MVGTQVETATVLDMMTLFSHSHSSQMAKVNPYHPVVLTTQISSQTAMVVGDGHHL